MKPIQSDKETCFVCGMSIPWDGQPNAIYHAWLCIRICLSPSCREIVAAGEKDKSKSERGRWRTRADAIAHINENKKPLTDATPPA